jgi:hypothetical protein
MEIIKMEYYSLRIETWERWNTQLFVNNISNEKPYGGHCNVLYIII